MDALNDGIRAVLIGDATLVAKVSGVFHRTAPRQTPGTPPKPVNPPYVLFYKLAGVPVYNFRSEAFRRYRYGIKAVAAARDGRTAQDIGDEIMARVHVLLQDATFAVTGWNVMDSREDGEIPPYDDKIGDLTVTHTGYFWQFHVQRA